MCTTCGFLAPGCEGSEGTNWCRLDSLVPGTPATAKSSRIGSMKKETPSMSRVRAAIPSGSPDTKTPARATPSKDPNTPT